VTRPSQETPGKPRRIVRIEASAHTATGAAQPPIADYGLIGDSRSTALVSRSGSMDWWCLPGPASDPIFARLLDTRFGGFFEIQPAEPFHATRRYLPDSPVLETTFRTAGGEARLLDFMPALTEADKRTHPVPFRMIVRRLRGERGVVRFRLALRPRPGFGKRTPRVRRILPTVYAFEWRDQALHLACAHPLAEDNGGLTADLALPAGMNLDLALAYSPESPADLPLLGSLDALEARTLLFWKQWSARCTYAGPYRDAVMRSVITLKLLTYAPSGAILAAPTTSLPESMGGVRNWDYRYCWLRDAAFTIRALLSLGYQNEAHAFAEWLLYATRLTHPELRMLYTVYGDSRLPEHSLAVPGYRDSRPVRVGNAATRQFQLDVYGDVADALTLYERSGGTFDRDGRALLRGIGRVLLRRWQQPDEGIWEVRSGRSQHIHSKVSAWVGLRRLIQLQSRIRLGLDDVELRKTSAAIQDWVLHHGYDPARGTFVRAAGRTEVDAALLVLPILGFLDGPDPRLAGTVDAVCHDLARGELVYRYLGPDGLPGREGAFVICSFWLVEALVHIGRREQARMHFEKLVARANDLGLLSEEIDPVSGEFLGNFPQGFSHIGLINAALTLARETGP
jgi:GH15 family glucan-1,4-alpha-glucosidase